MKIKIVELYKVYFNNNSFANFIKNRDIEFDIFWFLKKKPEKMFFNKRELIILEFRCLLILLIKIRSFRNKKVFCFGGHYSLMLFTKLFGAFLGPDYHLYIYNFYIHGLGVKKLIKIILHFLLNTGNTTLVVQSPGEVDYFNSLSKNNILFIPYCEDPGYTMDYSQMPDTGYLFSGGYSNRDYDLILECARLNPSIRFVLVVSKLTKDLKDKELTDNVTIYDEVDLSTFNGFIYNSFGVIIPLKQDVGASGQMLCLGAMKMSKPIIYCNISSVNYYFNHPGCGIPYTLGDIDSLNKSVRKLFSGECDFIAMGKKVFSHYFENYTLDKRNEKLLDLILKPEIKNKKLVKQVPY